MRTTKRRLGMLVTALVIGAGAILSQPRAARAAGDPYHEANRVWCYGGGNGLPTWDFIRVDAPVVYAYNYRWGIEDSQHFRWQAHLMKKVNGSWIYTNRSTGLSPWYLTTDGEGGKAYFYDAWNRQNARDLVIPERGFEYQVWVDIQWASSGTVPYSFWRRILPKVHLDGSGDGWFAGDIHGRNDPNVCDYIPDVGYVYLP